VSYLQVCGSFYSYINTSNDATENSSENEVYFINNDIVFWILEFIALSCIKITIYYGSLLIVSDD